METTFMNPENNKTNEPRKFVLDLSQKLGFRNSDKHVALQNFSIYLNITNAWNNEIIW